MELLGSIASTLLFVADVYALVMIVQSTAPTINKILWGALVIILPLIGLVAWYFMGPGKKPF